MTPRDPRVQGVADELIAAAGGSARIDNVPWFDEGNNIIADVEDKLIARTNCSLQVARGAVAKALRKSRNEERLKREHNQ